MPKGIRPYNSLTINGIKCVDIDALMVEIHKHACYSETHIRHLARNGQIPATRHRNRWWFDTAKVLQALGLQGITDLDANNTPNTNGSGHQNGDKSREICFI